MLRLIFIIIIYLSQQYCLAQVNLIKDGGFDDTTAAWQYSYCIRNLNHWQMIDTSDIDHNDVNAPFYCNLYWLVDTYIFKLPNNERFHTYPRSGSGAMGFDNYIDTIQYVGCEHCQSVLRGYLKNTLESGKQYCATIYAKAEVRENKAVTNGLGLYFDDGSIDTFRIKHKDSSGKYHTTVP
jgi:hypothetical protein